MPSRGSRIRTNNPLKHTLPPTDPCRRCIPGCPFPDGQSVLNLAAASAEDQSHEDTPLSIQPRYATALSRLPRLHKRCEASQVLKLDEARPPSPLLSQCAHHVNFEMWVSTLDGSASGPLLRRKRGKGTLSEGSKILTELDFLAALEHCEVVTQMTLSEWVSVLISLINALLKRTVHKDYLKAEAALYKRYAYYLTPEGFSETSRLVALYRDLALVHTARQGYAQIFEQVRAHGIRRIALAGGGELIKFAPLVAHSHPRPDGLRSGARAFVGRRSPEAALDNDWRATAP